MNKTMQRLAATALVAALVIASFFIGRASKAQGTEPGTPADPLVAKSYVDTLTVLQVINLKAGQTLTAEGGTEIVLRSGKAVVVTSTDGLSDVTGGKDLAKGVSVPLNHLLIVPRSDGRGIKATADAWVMVRGAFVIK